LICEERPLGEVTLDEREVREPERVLGGRDALVDARDRRRADAADLLDPPAPGEVVDTEHPLVGAVRDPEGRRPPDVAVGPGDDDGHGYSLSE
jgi:hypothetical protein